MDFETLLRQHYGPLERYVKFRMEGTGQGEDVLQEVCLTAFQRFGQLRDPSRFKPWILQIARNKCRDYYRRERPELIPLEEAERLPAQGDALPETVRETLAALPPRDRQLLELTYFQQLSQAEIAQRLEVPVGTVKSRMHAAKRRFRDCYPIGKGESSMKQLPLILPEYTITPSAEPPFAVQYEEIPGWFIVPREGETLKWAMYDQPSRKQTMYVDIQVLGKAQVHGVEGVLVRSVEHDPVPSEQIGTRKDVERYFVAQLTDTHCRILAESHTDQEGVRKYFTFMDGDEFLENWGYGPENVGTETALTRRGMLSREGNAVTVAEHYRDMVLPDAPMDIVGRYEVTIDGKTYDTVLFMLVETWNGGAASIMTETYIDQNGRTVLWRRFNRNDWALDHFHKTWTELLPDNERVTVNGETYVHWYDCVMDYVM